MCGVFGFITTEGHGPDISRLRRLAMVTQTRGEHAFGLAWLDEDGAIRTFKRPGPASEYLDELDRCKNAVAMIGHCRYATHGSPADNRNNHPHVAGSGYIVHNGVIFNHDQIVRHHKLKQRSQCDSEALGLLITRCGGNLAQRSAWTVAQVTGELAMLGLWRYPARLLICRRGRPLHFGRSRDGYYFASLPQGLPGQVSAIADNSTRVLAYRDGRLSLDGEALALPENCTGV